MFLSIALCLIVLVIISVIVLYLAMRRRQKLRAQLVFSTFEGKHILITGAAHGIGRGKLNAIIYMHFKLFAYAR